jgi:hypothetical protein
MRISKVFERAAPLAVTAAFACALLLGPVGFASAQTADKPAEAAKASDAAKDSQSKDNQKKIDEIAEAARIMTGPAANAECVWLGRRVVSLLWRDDLDTAFRHLDLYDRFGCPSGHIQSTFRCLVRQGGTIDPKVQESLNGRVHACWIDPALASAASPPAAAQAPAGPANSSGSGTTTR